MTTPTPLVADILIPPGQGWATAGRRGQHLRFGE